MFLGREENNHRRGESKAGRERGKKRERKIKRKFHNLEGGIKVQAEVTFFMVTQLATDRVV